VLVFTPHNDIADVNRDTAADAYRPFYRLVDEDSLSLDASFVDRFDYRMREAINPFKQRSALVSLVIERYNASSRVRAQQALAPAGLTREQRMCTSSPDSVFTANYALCRALIERMARVCSARDIHFMVTAVPLVYEARVIRELRKADGSFDAGFFDRDLGTFASAQGIDFVGLGAGFMERNRTTGETLHWRHWNYAGHRLVASTLADHLAASAAGSQRPSD
jgi:hypothetical protein